MRYGDVYSLPRLQVIKRYTCVLAADRPCPAVFINKVSETQLRKDLTGCCLYRGPSSAAGCSLLLLPVVGVLNVLKWGLRLIQMDQSVGVLKCLQQQHLAIKLDVLRPKIEPMMNGAVSTTMDTLGDNLR